MKKCIIKNIERPNAEIIEKYKQFDASSVYEAQGKTGLLNHGLKPIIENNLICGPAVTAICYAGSNLMVHAAIEVCKPGDILVIKTIGESNAGMIGDLIVRALIKKGVQGVIIDAGIRDVQELKKLKFPVWCKAIHSEGTTKDRAGWVNVPTVCRDVHITPGDLIIADDDGVVSVEKNNLEDTLKLTKERIKKEEKVKEKIQSGQISMDFYDLRDVLKKHNVVYFENEEDYLNRGRN